MKYGFENDIKVSKNDTFLGCNILFPQNRTSLYKGSSIDLSVKEQEYEKALGVFTSKAEWFKSEKQTPVLIKIKCTSIDPF